MKEMITVTVSLKTQEEAKEFVAAAGKFPFEMDLRSGRYVVDAKSILGILSLGNRDRIYLDIYEKNCAALLEAIARFRITD